MNWGARWRLVVFVGASLLAHALMTLVLPAREPAAPVQEPDWAAFELASLQALPESATESATEPEPVAEPATEPVAVTESAPESESVAESAPESVAESVAEPVAGSESVAVTEPASESATAAEPVTAAPVLSPRAVALSMVDALGEAECAPSDPRRACEVRAPTPSAGERLQRAADAAAGDIPHLAPRPKPKLARKHDGTHRYDGAAFRAIVERDGHVRFEDKVFEPELRLGPNVDDGPLDGTPRILSLGIGLEMGFDLMDIVEKHVLQEQIYSAEKKWFLDETRELRMELQARARAEELARGLRRLRGKLLRILDDDGRTPADRRAEIFALWDGCSGDEVGIQAQQLIEAFVREHMPRGSALGYGDAELATLNAARVSQHPFAPYG